MLVVGLGLMAFGVLGITRPVLFAGRALPIAAAIAGLLFAVVAAALTRVPQGLDAIALEQGCLVMYEAGERVAVGLANIQEIHVVEEPLGRGHPLLCVGTFQRSFVEVAPVRYGPVEAISQALREALEHGFRELPECPEGVPVRVTAAGFEVAGTQRRFELSAVRAVDFVHHASVLGPGLVVHTEPLEPLATDGMIDAASILRRVAVGEHIALPGVTRSAGVALALQIDRALGEARKAGIGPAEGVANSGSADGA